MSGVRAMGRVLISLATWMCVFQHLHAGSERANIRGMGMARTFVATSRGLDAVGINPANLALPDSGTVSVNILPFGIHVGSDVLDYELYTSYFTGVQTENGRVARYLTESDKQRLLSAFGDGLSRTTLDVDAQLLGVSYRLEGVGAFSFTVSDHLSAFLKIPRAYAEFLVNGNPPGSTYDFSATDAKASWTREYALSFGTAIPDVSFLRYLAAGAAMKIVQGYGYYEVQHFNTSLVTADNGALTGAIDFLARGAGDDPTPHNIVEQLSGFSKSAGTGYGFDIGIAGAVNTFLSFGMSVTDIGWMRWYSNTQQWSADSTIVVDDPLNNDQRNAIEHAVKGQKRSVEPFTVSLPTTLRLGVSFAVHKMPGATTMPGELLVALDYNQGFQEIPGSTTSPRVSLGVEYKPVHWLPLRSGVSFGGTDHINVALGIGVDLGVFDLDLASENVNWLFAPKSFSHGSIAGGMRIRL
jgi:hypothetical protein